MLLAVGSPRAPPRRNPQPPRRRVPATRRADGSPEVTADVDDQVHRTRTTDEQAQRSIGGERNDRTVGDGGAGDEVEVRRLRQRFITGMHGDEAGTGPTGRGD